MKQVVKIKANRKHVEKINKWYEEHGGRVHVLSEYIVEVNNEAIESTLKKS